MKAIETVAKLNAGGKKARFSVLPTLEETKAFAAARGIAEVISVGEDKE